jgi:serine/arginine repetitive matrix protein 1
MKFEENILTTKIEWSKIRLDVIKPWITKRIGQLLGMEDDVVTEFIFNQLDEKDVDPRKMQINLTGFLNGKNARIFIGEMWAMLDSAQKSEKGIPQELLEMKKEEIKNREVSVRELHEASL